MNSLVTNLERLGMKEYEAKVYSTLVGLGESNVRRIHEVSGVPRPRVYDVLQELAAKGFIDIRQGSPLVYCAVRPDIVISYLKKDLDAAARESVQSLETLKLGAQQNYSPIWYVYSDWTIQRNLEMVTEGVVRELVVLCFDLETLKKFQGPLSRTAKMHPVKILFPKGIADQVYNLEGIACFEAGTLKNFFGINIFEKVFSTPISRDGAVFRLECILLADDRESMLIYTLDGNRMAVIITLPIITAVQSQHYTQMIQRARNIRQPGM